MDAMDKQTVGSAAGGSERRHALRLMGEDSLGTVVAALTFLVMRAVVARAQHCQQSDLGPTRRQ
jgi:hypothetical protein